MRTAAIAIAGLLAALTPAAARAGDPDALAHAKLFALYCAKCHGLNGAPGRAGVPDLSGLAAREPTPFPTERLVDFVVSERRPGGPNVCGERVFARLPSAAFHELADRMTVRAALAYVAAAGRAE